MYQFNPSIIRLFVGLLLILALSNCNKNLIYNESIDFEDYKWPKSKAVIFEPIIANELVKKPLKLEVNIRHIQGFPYKFLHLRVFLTNPKSETEYQDISIQIISDSGEYNGDGAGDYWDLNYVIDNELIMEMPGKYKIELKPFMEVDPINFIDQIELMIEKTEKESSQHN